MGTGWRLSKKTAERLGDKDIHNATLWGGNLSVLVSLLGTPYFPAVKGGILFFEDVGEHPYRVERMLTQLLYAGALAQQKAILVGQFTNYKLTDHDKGFQLQTVWDRLSAQLKVPVVVGLPFGHVPTKVMLPMGTKIDLNVQDREVLLLWDH